MYQDLRRSQWILVAREQTGLGDDEEKVFGGT
jgi:hypothetical protein